MRLQRSGGGMIRSRGAGDAAPRGGDEGNRAAERALHARLLAGDATAPADLVEQYLPFLVARLTRRFPRVDPQEVESAAVQTLFKTAQQPQRYQPDRARLDAYLYMDARGDVLNALESARRRAAREQPMGPVELIAAARNLSREGDDPAEIVLGGERVDPSLLDLLREVFADQEWEVVRLMIDDERDTRVYARLLGLEHLPPAEQRRAVKRVKDRLDKRLRRLAQRIRSDG